VFQGVLIKLLLSDREFASGIAGYIEPAWFSNPVHAWAWDYCRQYNASIGAYPTMGFLVNAAAADPLHAATLAQVRDTPITDEHAVRAQAVDFVRRAVFKQAILDCRDLYNLGRYSAAYDVMRERMGKLDGVSLEPTRQSWIADEFVARHISRQDDSYYTEAIATGIPELDNSPTSGGVFDGGLHKGEMGIWLAYPKAGKTTYLCNLGAVAVRTQRRKTWHGVLEGSLTYVEARYDTIFTGELYSNVKRGDIDAALYARAFKEMQELRGLLVVQDFTKTMDANVGHFDSVLRDLERGKGFVPDLLIVDYVDLLRSRFRYDREYEEQKAAVQDLKNLANRGYAVWTASQVQRPKNDDYAEVAHILRSKDIADCYAKVRVADFIGSINQTTQERSADVLRLYAELYRDGPADKTITVKSDFSRMTMSALPPGMPGPPAQAPVPVQGGDAGKRKDLGYGATLKQTRAGG